MFMFPIAVVLTVKFSNKSKLKCLNVIDSHAFEWEWETKIYFKL